MKRTRIGLAALTVGVLILAALFAQKKPAGKLLVLEWAGKSSLERPPVAVLIEFGHQDTAATDWSGEVAAKGATIVHREGYRFRSKAGDELTGRGWKASSHRGLRVPARNPAVARIEGIATVGVVLHLNDVQKDAALNLNLTGLHKAQVAVSLKDVLAGKSHPILTDESRRIESTSLQEQPALFKARLESPRHLWA